MKNWYMDILGCRVVRESGDAQNKYLRLDLDGFWIDMLQIKGSYRQPSQDLPTAEHMNAQGYRHLVVVATDFLGAYNVLKKKGVVLYNDKDVDKKDIAQHIFLKDPEGNVIELLREGVQ